MNGRRTGIHHGATMYGLCQWLIIVYWVPLLLDLNIIQSPLARITGAAVHSGVIIGDISFDQQESTACSEVSFIFKITQLIATTVTMMMMM
jgi:hypothetical protein